MKIFGFKKATQFIAHIPFLICYTAAVAIVTILIVVLSGVSVEDASRIPQDLEDEIILISRFYNSEDCFAYKDNLKGVNTGVIDANKFKQGNMEKCFPRSNVKYAFSLSLEASDTRLEQGFNFNTATVSTFNWAGGYAPKEVMKNVLVFYDGKKYNGKLRIKIKDV